MIRCILRGRTGNILFQYAFGRYLSEKHGTELILDGSWYNLEGWREVSHLLNRITKGKVVRRLPIACRFWRKVSGRHYWSYLGLPMLIEPSDNHSFQNEFLDAPSNVILYGYFQTPLYFGDMADKLRAEIRELIATDPIHKKLSKPNSVAVHVRRGDYLHHPAFLVCDRSYYENAMNEMRQRVPNARFHIFSDDPVWCRDTFRNPDCEVMESHETTNNPLLDLHAMSQASHHIIANSSYSWWAAWLAAHPQQQIIMPDKWFNNDGILAPIQQKHWNTHTSLG